MKKYFFSLVIFSLLLVPTLALAQGNVVEGLTNTGTAGGFNSGNNSVGLTEALAGLATALTVLLGVFFVILIVYSGWLWLTARGNEDQVGRAKKILVGSIIGLAIVIGARLIAELAVNLLSAALPE